MSLRACLRCIDKKRRCDHVHPVCGSCAKAKLSCDYPPPQRRRAPVAKALKRAEERMQEYEDALWFLLGLPAVIDIVKSVQIGSEPYILPSAPTTGVDRAVKESWWDSFTLSSSTDLLAFRKQCQDLHLQSDAMNNSIGGDERDSSILSVYSSGRTRKMLLDDRLAREDVGAAHHAKRRLVSPSPVVLPRHIESTHVDPGLRGGAESLIQHNISSMEVTRTNSNPPLSLRSQPLASSLISNDPFSSPLWKIEPRDGQSSDQLSLLENYQAPSARQDGVQPQVWQTSSPGLGGQAISNEMDATGSGRKVTRKRKQDIFW